MSAVLTENTSVYMAGSRPAAHGATTVAYFGILNLATGTIASRMVPPHNAPANVSGSFTSLIDQGGQVYVGGIYQAHVNVSWFANYLGGYLYRYSPSTGRFLNDSSVLPSGGINGAGVIQLEPWGKNIAIVDYANFINFTYFAQSTYTYVLSHHGNVLTNVTALLPSQFFSASNLLTEPRGGPYIAAGWDNPNGDGEMVSVRV